MNEPQSGYPLHWPTGWPRTKTPSESRFGHRGNPPTTAHGRDALMLELGRLRAHRVVISTNQQLKLDGTPYSNRSEPNDRGAAVYFRLKDQPRVLACDKWKTIGENLYAIAKTIEATRGIERWGSVTTEQAFAGYAALPEKTQLSCWELLELDEQVVRGFTSIESREGIIVEAWRRKVKLTHPQNGGTPESFAAVNAAKDMALQLIKQ